MNILKPDTSSQYFNENTWSGRKGGIRDDTVEEEGGGEEEEEEKEEEEK